MESNWASKFVRSFMVMVLVGFADNWLNVS